MKLSTETALQLLDEKKFISFRFHFFDPNTTSYYRSLTKTDVMNFSNQFVELDNYVQPISGGIYTHNWHHLYLQKQILLPNKKNLQLCVYSKRTSSEFNEFNEFQSLIGEYPDSYQYYLGDLEEDNKTLDLIVFINMDLFVEHYKKNRFLSKNMVKIIQKYALNQYKIYKLKDCSDENEYNEISPSFKLSLFDYQKQTLNWMLRTENKDYKFMVPESSFYELGKNAYVQVVCKSTKLQEDFMSQYVFESDYKSDEMVKCHGGILADIMGNGKTVTTIALIYHNQAKMMPILTSIIEREVYIPSRATLVVCPTNIASQWESEIYKCLGKSACGLKICKITTKAQMNKYDLSQIVNADIIITTYDWLTNIKHIGTNFVKKGRSTELLSEQKNNRIQCGDHYQSYPSFTLLFIKYHRIIYDEYHEEIDSTSGQNITLYLIKHCLRARNTWGISGTPLLENEKIMKNIPDLLQIRNTQNHVYELDLISQQEVYDRFVRRNEKQYLPPIDYRVVHVKQTVKEKQLYESSLSQDTETLLQLCSYHNINSLNIQSIDDVSNFQDELRKKQKMELTEKIEEITANLKQIEAVLKALCTGLKHVSELYYLVDSTHPQHNHKLIQQIQQNPTLQLQADSVRQYRKYDKQLQTTTDDLNKLEQCMKYYDCSLKNILKDGQFACPITGEPVGNGEVVITKNGHLFSKSAIELLFEYGDGKYIICPVTGDKLGRIDISIVSNQKEDEAISSTDRLFGSKISCLIGEIESLKPNEKIVIFAKYDKLLHTIGYALDMANINHVYIKGNINIRDKSIHEFRTNPKTRAILLSSEFGASGVNLSEATHVYIVHPFYGDDGLQYEKQAIGRAHRTGQTQPVHVSFFITENTIENEIWEKNRKNYYMNSSKITK